MSWPTTDPEGVFTSRDLAIRVWIADDGGLTMHARERSGEPVKISPKEARRLAAEILRLTERDEDR